MQGPSVGSPGGNERRAGQNRSVRGGFESVMLRTVPGTDVDSTAQAPKGDGDAVKSSA